jgi:hypothetical protein
MRSRESPKLNKVISGSIHFAKVGKYQKVSIESLLYSISMRVIHLTLAAIHLALEAILCGTLLYAVCFIGSRSNYQSEQDAR